MLAEVSPSRGIVYGVVQGLTEFLPISSSAHLLLLPWFAGWSDPGLAFGVALHAGTLVAVLWYFWRDWWALGRGALLGLARGQPMENEEARTFWKIVAATAPAALCGWAMQDLAETTFRAPALTASALAGVAVLLLIGDRRPESRSGLSEVSWADALWIGLAQATALVPGVSRSGATITAARFRELDRETAARFSFLLSMPVIAGATLVEARELPAAAFDAGLLAGVGAAALSGLAAIGGLLRWVRARSFVPFVVYRLALAAVITAVLLLRA